VVEVPDADPLGFQGSGLLPTLVSCQISREREREREGHGDGLRVEHSLSCSLPRWLLRKIPLSLSLSTFSLNSSTVFYASNQTLSHMHALSHSLVHVNSAVQLTADQYEKCYENDITHEQLTAIGDPSCFMLIRDV